MSRSRALLGFSQGGNLINPNATLYPVAHQAARVGVNPKTLRRRIKDGTLPAYRVAGSRIIRLDPADVDALMLLVAPAGAAA